MLLAQRAPRPPARLPLPSQQRLFFVAAGLLIAGETIFWTVLAAVQSNSGVADLDAPVHDGIVASRTPLATAILAAVTTVTSPLWMTVIGCAVALAWAVFKREVWRPALLVGAMAATFAVSTLVKHDVGRSRPAAVGAVPADAAVFLELAPLSPDAVATLAGDRADSLYATTAGNPFYVTELLACASTRGRFRGRSRTRCGVAPRGSTSRRGVLLELVSVVPNRVPVLGARRGDVGLGRPRRGAGAAPAARDRAGYVRFRHELARHAIASSMTAAARRRVHAGILAALLEAGGGPRRDRPSRRGGGRGGSRCRVRARWLRAGRGARIASRGVLPLSPRRGLRRPAARRRAGALLDELASAAYVVGALDVAFPSIERAIGLYRDLGD